MSKAVSPADIFLVCYSYHKEPTTQLNTLTNGTAMSFKGSLPPLYYTLLIDVGAQAVDILNDVARSVKPLP